MKESRFFAYMEKPMLDMETNQRLRLENYKEFLDLTEDRIRIAAGRGFYEITGEALRVRAVSRREIFIEGRIRNIQVDFKEGDKKE